MLRSWPLGLFGMTGQRHAESAADNARPIHNCDVDIQIRGIQRRRKHRVIQVHEVTNQKRRIFGNIVDWRRGAREIVSALPFSGIATPAKCRQRVTVVDRNRDGVDSAPSCRDPADVEGRCRCTCRSNEQRDCGRSTNSCCECHRIHSFFKCLTAVFVTMQNCSREPNPRRSICTFKTKARRTVLALRRHISRVHGPASKS